jgi:hypothetical protein
MAMGKATRWMTVHLLNGTKMKFTFPQQTDEANVGSMLEQALSKKVLILEVDGSAVFIPFASIAKVEVMPKPPRLPPYAIRGAKLGN